MTTTPFTDHCPASPDGKCDMLAGEPLPDPTGQVGPLTVVRCLHCGVGVTRPPLPDVGFLYEGRDSQDFQPGTMGLARLIKRIAFSRQARAMLHQLGVRPAQVVDFGCGGGLFTACLAQVLGPGSSVTGADFHSEAPAELEGMAYLSLPQLAARPTFADALIAMHVLEHDDDPLTLLNAMVHPVKSGGRLLIEVPNIDCIWASVFGRHWDGWYLPYHRVHFSRVSLRALIERAGLRVVSEHDIAVPSLGRTAALMLGRRNGTGFILLTAALFPLQRLVETISGRPSALRVVAEKP